MERNILRKLMVPEYHFARRDRCYANVSRKISLRKHVLDREKY